MTWIGELWRQLRYRLSGARFDDDLAEEMRLHVDLRSADKQAGGLAPDAAQAAAQRQFGNATQLQESSRDAWGWTRLDSWRQDMRYGLRTLAANPGFTATAVLSLALGIGANTAIFSILNAVLLRSLPVEAPQRLVQLRLGAEGDDELTNPIWEQVRDRQQAFSGMLAYAPDRFDLADGGESHNAVGLWVSGDFFRVLGVPAIEGRVFTRDEDRRGTAPLAVISYSFWKRNFDGDAGVIGKTVRLNRHTFEIVGVTPPWFRGLDTDWGFDVAIPIACEPILHPGHSSLDERAAWWLRIIARLPGRMPAGESVEQARDRMRAIAPEIFRATVPQDFPTDAQREYLNNSFFLKPAATGFSEMGAQYRTALYTLMAIVGVVLLIACANIANLLLARATARQREFSVRMAIGAGRARVIRQLMTESLLLSVFGTAAGLLLALWGSRLLIHLLSTTRHPLDIDLSLDPHVLAFTIGAAILTALLFGLAPALRATRVELNQVMKENTRTVLRASGRLNLGKALVAGQVALSLVLLVAAGLFLGTLRNLWAVDPGFTRHNILIITADVEQAAVPAAQRAGTYREILDRLRALPGVAAAASSVLTPISPEGWAQMVRPEGFVAKSPRDTLLFLNRISPGYFATLQTPLLLGRDFSDRDSLNAPKAMIVNESAARQFFGAANPIGKTIGMDKDDVYQIVGVVKDTKYNRINEQDRRIGYLADGQDTEPRPSIRFTLRSDVPVETLIPAARAAIGGVNHGISLEFRNLETQVSESLLQPRTVALLSSVFGSLALLLAMVGLYGITSYAVTRRKGEIAIRMALGAPRGTVVWLMLRDVAVLLAVGMAVGLAASVAAGRLVTSLLFGVRPRDPVQLAGAVVVLAVATAVAAYLPARRAARLDPMAALREE
jgi:predicted permease